MRELTYCTNIHPGESWADVRANLESHLLGVKARVSPERRFPIGLRVSGLAAGEIDELESRRFRAWCEENDCFVLTVNGFPHGRFHGAGVKQRVYLPDWREPARAEYTCRLADLLAGWLPAGIVGSISTVPVAFRHGFEDEHWAVVRTQLAAVLEHLSRIYDETGVEIALALEPEPRCVLEQTSEAVAFFERMDFPPQLGRFLALCYDCCHQAVEFEDPGASLAALRTAGVPIAKVQVSSSLCARDDEIEALPQFDEPTYLHQVVARTSSGDLHRFDDLPDFAEALKRERFVEARSHFHIPIFSEHLGPCGTTRFFLEELLPQIDPEIPFEVETYSWDVLSPELRGEEVVDDIARELTWASRFLGGL
jgi:hypothetical protein